ncbi:hypothetical protein [Paraferrimonas sp. SM1919]|uniref:hypothetical protein n=1 Tax=Paraferrimonas sp. SM1919 TaxID=2662263 RepID=UPI0013D09482|nr:hypothetical protein [Paraferrimonas sp. SM1919]
MNDENINIGDNDFLGSLICYSCQQHNRCSYDDKHIFSNDHTLKALIFANGRIEVADLEGNPADAIVQFQHQLLSITPEVAHNFGQGIAVKIGFRLLECSSCGSQEFTMEETE